MHFFDKQGVFLRKQSRFSVFTYFLALRLHQPVCFIRRINFDLVTDIFHFSDQYMKFFCQILLFIDVFRCVQTCKM
jgi:hypothetical protein